MAAALTDLPRPYILALDLIDEAHAQDPRKVALDDGTGRAAKGYSIFAGTTTGTAGGADGASGAGDGNESKEDGEKKTTTTTMIPYELHYAQKMTRWLGMRCPDPSPELQVACRAQHFRRWEMPRDTFPKTRPGYLTWRAKQKSQAAQQVSDLLLTRLSPPLAQGSADRIASLIRKENLSGGHDEEAQILEDVACLVFLDDQIDDFDRDSGVDEDKMVGILRKTWAKMSTEGQKLALQMALSDRAREMVARALDG